MQFSNDLGQANLWGGNKAEVPDANSTVNGVIFVITENVADTNYIDVVADIPAGGGKIFARLVGAAP